MYRTLFTLVVVIFAAAATRLNARGFGGHHTAAADSGRLSPSLQYGDINRLTDGLLYRLGGISNLTVGQFYDSDLAGVGRGETTPGAFRAGSGDVGHPRFRGLNVGGQNDGRFSAPRVTGFHPSGFPSGLRPAASAAPPLGSKQDGRARLPPSHRMPAPATSQGAGHKDYRALPSDGGLHFLSGSVDTDF